MTGPVADFDTSREYDRMDANFTPTADHRAILERLRAPERIEVRLQRPSFALNTNDAETVREALTEELARVGFDPNYELTVEGRLIESLIDALFIP